MIKPDQVLQNNLFGEPELTAMTVAPVVSNIELDDEGLRSDAAARPRIQKASVKTTDCSPVGKHEPVVKNGNLAWRHHSSVKSSQLTPILRHYVELKAAHPERILLYRLGDFFECFFEDAIQLSQILGLTLTGKDGGRAIGRVPMAGIPHHAAERHCTELIRHGFSVALCDQLETVPIKGMPLKRGITRVFTPGTVLEEGMLKARSNNWLVAVLVEEINDHLAYQWGLASVDVSTGEVQLQQGEGDELLQQELTTLETGELLWSSQGKPPTWCLEQLRLTHTAITPFSLPEADASLRSYYGLRDLAGLGLEDQPLARRAFGGLLHYLDETQPLKAIASAVPLERPKLLQRGTALVLDAQTRRNLELTKTQRDNHFQGSLLWAVDRTLTAMGGRCLRRWIEAPLLDLKTINHRQTIVSLLVAQRPLRLLLRQILRPIADLERLAGRAGGGHASPRDLVAISNGLEQLPPLKAFLKSAALGGDNLVWLDGLLQPNPALADLVVMVKHQLLANPSSNLSEGGLICDGVDPLLDGLRNKLDDQDAWLLQQESKERLESRISTLRLRYHRTIGYFLAVSHAKALSVPNHWIRRQSLANEERFVTPELKNREGLILQLRARAAQREYELFCKLREHVGEQVKLIRRAARAIANLDALAGLADIAATSGWVAPEVTEGRELEITAGRHPVVEKLLVEKHFTPNSTHLGSNHDLLILTGPNSSGKSCYLRQIALIQLLAQIGSWVPAQSARLGLTDRIFTRVGAVDDIATGQSTFMVEMIETSVILHHATEQSLVLLDEVGRGTTARDGLAIAWAVSEYLATNLRSRTVFATHYHELGKLENRLNNIASIQVLVRETSDNKLVFLHRVASGCAKRSYGIDVARMAGVPPLVIQRSRQVLTQLQLDTDYILT
ncbi:DNA mismatch repair protein MutS [cyanobiont of Ornithocercus magnificus]|nr:DNA mismatch repair protein MutS [cyanobiont of Ornithocercus magnificus]